MRRSIIWGLGLLLIFTMQGLTTNVVSEGVLARYYYVDEPNEIQFVASNDSNFTADKYTATVTVKDKQGNVVFDDEVEGTDLKPYTKDTLSTQIKWTPTLTGYYDLSVKLDFEWEVYPEDNEKTVEVPVIISRSTAASVLNSYLPSLFTDLEKVWAFMPQEPLQPGDKLESFDTREFSVSLDSWKYLGWVDWGKDFNFAHPGYYVTIDAFDSSKVDTNYINWYPKINGLTYLGDYDERINSDDRVYGTDPEQTVETDTETITDQSSTSATGDSICVLLVTGSEDSDREREARQFNIDVIRNNLMNESLGVNLPESSFETLRNPTRQQIIDKIRSMKDKCKAVYFYYTGHGWDGGMCTSDTANAWIGYWDLANELYDTNAQDINVILDTCHSGSAIEWFDSYRKRDRNVTVLTSCTADTLSWRYVIQNDGNGDAIWGSFFTWAWVKCYGDPAADANNDGMVSLVEAFDCVRAANPELDGDHINTLMNPQRFTHRAVVPPAEPEQPVTVPDSDLRITANDYNEYDLDMGVTVKTYGYDDEFYVEPYGGGITGLGTYKYYNTEYYFTPADVEDYTKYTLEFKYTLGLDVYTLNAKLGLVYRDSSDSKWNVWEKSEIDTSKQTVYGYDINKDGYWALGTITLETAVDGSEQIVAAPLGYRLEQNYPNPFNPATKIMYSIPSRQHVKLAVYDITGRTVALLFEGVQDAGIHQLGFDASALSSGTYFVRIESGDYTAIRKMVYVR